MWGINVGLKRIVIADRNSAGNNCGKKIKEGSKVQVSSCKIKEEGDRILLLLKIKSVLPPFVNSTIQFYPVLLSFQRAPSALPRNVENNIPGFVD